MRVSKPRELTIPALDALPPKKQGWSAAEDALIRRYYAAHGCSRLAQHWPAELPRRTRGAISARACTLGLSSR